MKSSGMSQAKHTGKEQINRMVALPDEFALDFQQTEQAYSTC